MRNLGDDDTAKTYGLKARKRRKAKPKKFWGKSYKTENDNRTWRVYTANIILWDGIFNYDESGISTVLSTPKIFADKSQKQAYHSNPVTTPNEITGGEELAIAGDELATVSAELGDVSTRTPPNHLENQEFIQTRRRRLELKNWKKFGKNNRKRLEKEQKSKAREIKRALSLLNEDCDKSSKPKRKKTKEIETISSNSETDVILRESSVSPFDMLEENEEDNYEEPVDPENSRLMPMC
ncbi:hypothetical protein EVAR_12103_1 [Eumeta japonica]|uniref:Uncharacterized protein n=1 Tax=Eumeta variegata TaxID=151549 RepID=A0A4C1U573_EUMVA|nr:hypothetical protein EVAR_12103_1 [Eumeta japonica]